MRARTVVLSIIDVVETLEKTVSRDLTGFHGGPILPFPVKSCPYKNKPPTIKRNLVSYRPKRRLL